MAQIFSGNQRTHQCHYRSITDSVTRVNVAKESVKPDPQLPIRQEPLSSRGTPQPAQAASPMQGIEFELRGPPPLPDTLQARLESLRSAAGVSCGPHPPLLALARGSIIVLMQLILPWLLTMTRLLEASDFM